MTEHEKQGEGAAGPRITQGIAVGLAIGPGLGLVLGMILFDNIALGAGLGLALGVALGAGAGAVNTTISRRGTNGEEPAPDADGPIDDD